MRGLPALIAAFHRHRGTITITSENGQTQCAPQEHTEQVMNSVLALVDPALLDVAQLDPASLDPGVCYHALQTRDARFDGRFFTAVTTTGIYCRPICPARTPKRENVVFYPTAAAAQEAGFRPCLRCRPETSPDLGAWRGTSNTVSRALSLIETGALDEDDVAALAGR